MQIFSGPLCCGINKCPKDDVNEKSESYAIMKVNDGSQNYETSIISNTNDP